MTTLQMIREKQRLKKAFAIPVVVCSADFEKGIELFDNYKPVKILRELKDEFQKALIDHFISNDVMEWSSTQTPLKLYWKFKRM